MRNRSACAALLAAVLCAPAAAAGSPSVVFTIPGTVNAAGLNGTRFVSDLAVTNPGSAPAQLTLALVPANGTAPRAVTLGAGATVVYRNLLDGLWGAQGAAATRVSSDVPVLVRARTYNAAPGGTYGVALPVVADERFLAPGPAAHSLWVSQSANGSSGFRTNVAVAFPDEGGGAATVTVYDAEGAAVGSQDYSLDAAGFQQFGVGGFAGAAPVARAEMQVTRGRAAGYTVVVDNVTGDSSLFSFEELPAGYQDVLVNGVARANGRNATFFRTDGRFFNLGDEDAVVKASFHAAGSSNASPVSRTFTVGAGRILDVVDVLDTLLGLPVGSAGAVRFETDAAVGILCRTSNVDPAGGVPGTFGAQQKPTPLLSFLMSADAGGVVTGIRQGAAFRTNVGFAAGPEGAGYALTLKTAAGAAIATASASLGPFGWTQPNVQDLFPNATVPDDATLLVNVTSGSVDVFDSSIDNASGDPVVTPVMPLPALLPSSATIGPEGGSVRSADGRMTLKVPAGAFAGPVAVALAAEASGESDALGIAYALSPSPLPLVRSALLVFRPADGPAPEFGLAGVGIGMKTGSGVFMAGGGSVDPAAGTLTVPMASTNASATSGDDAARRSLAESSLIGPFTSLVFSPQSPTVLTDASVDVGLFLQSEPSAGGRPPGWTPRASAGTTSATFRWTRPPASLGRIDRTSGASVTFTGPHRIRRGFSVTDLPVSVRTIYVRIDVRAHVWVVRRNWKIETEVVVHEPCLGFYKVDYFWNEQGTFFIADNHSITKNSAATAQTSNPADIWSICNLFPHGFTTITPTSDMDVDVRFDRLSSGGELSFFNRERRSLEIWGRSVFTPGGSVLTGPSVSPFVVDPKGPFEITFLGEIRLVQEGDWFDVKPVLSITTHRHRFISIDTP